MDKLSVLANIAEIVGVIVVIGGLFFAVMQMRQYRQQRRELAAIELFRFFGNPHFAQAYKTVLNLPADTPAETIKANENNIENCAMLIGTTMENIGVMTFQRIVPFQVVDNLIGNSTVILWGKLRLWIETLRTETGNPAAFEWFQWLAERLAQNSDPAEPPAHIAEIDWQPASKRHRF